MGGISDFIFGSKSKEQNSSQSSSSSSSGNQAYNTLSQALSPTLGYSSGAGSMIGSLLGIPGLGGGILGMGGGAPSGPGTYTYDPNSGQAGGGMPTHSGPGIASLFGVGGGRGENAGARFENDQPVGPGAVGQEQPSPLNLLNESRPQIQTQPQPQPTSASSGLENFSNSAGMDFLRNQGVKAIESSQAGKGMLQSGATGKALSSFGNNLATTYLNDYLGHLMDYANLGTKNAAVLGSSGNVSNSTGLSFGSGNSTGGKNGLLNNIIAAI